MSSLTWTVIFYISIVLATTTNTAASHQRHLASFSTCNETEILQCTDENSCANLTLFNGINMETNSQAPCTVECIGQDSCEEANISSIHSITCYEDSCDGAVFSRIDTVICDVSESSTFACTYATFINVTTLECAGVQSCRFATIRNADTITCGGSGSCNSVNIDVSNTTTIHCNGDSSCQYDTLRINKTGIIDELNCNGESSCQSLTFYGENSINVSGVSVINEININGESSVRYSYFYSVSIGTIQTTVSYSLWYNYFYDYSNVSNIYITNGAYYSGYGNIFYDTTYIDTFECKNSDSYTCRNNNFYTSINSFKCDSGSYSCAYNSFYANISEYSCDAGYDGCKYLIFAEYIDTFECKSSGYYSCTWITFKLANRIKCEKDNYGCRYINVTDYVNTFICKKGANCDYVFLNGVGKIIQDDTTPTWKGSIINSGDRGKGLVIRGEFSQQKEHNDERKIICGKNDTCRIYDSGHIKIEELRCYGSCRLYDDDTKPNIVEFPLSNNCGSWVYYSLVMNLPMIIIHMIVAFYWLYLHNRVDACFGIINKMYLGYSVDKHYKANVYKNNEKYVVKYVNCDVEMILDEIHKNNYINNSGKLKTDTNINKKITKNSNRNTKKYFGFDIGEEFRKLVKRSISEISISISNTDLALPKEIVQLIYDYYTSDEIECDEEDVIYYVFDILPGYFSSYQSLFRCLIIYQFMVCILILLTDIFLFIEYFQWENKVDNSVEHGYHVKQQLTTSEIELYGIYNQDIVYISTSGWHYYQSFGAMWMTNFIFYKYLLNYGLFSHDSQTSLSGFFKIFAGIIPTDAVIKPYNNNINTYDTIDITRSGRIGRGGGLGSKLSVKTISNPTIMQRINASLPKIIRPATIIEKFYSELFRNIMTSWRLLHIPVLFLVFLPTMISGLTVILIPLACLIVFLAVYFGLHFCGISPRTFDNKVLKSPISFVIFIICFVVCCPLVYLTFLMFWRLTYFGGVALFRGNEWVEIIWGKYSDWDDTYCTNDNVLLIPNQVNVRTIIIWLGWFFG